MSFKGLYLEAVYLLECIAPATLHVDRFLPPTPVRVLVDHRGADAGSAIPAELLKRHLKNGDAYALLDRPELREELLPRLLENTKTFARAQVSTIVTRAREEMTIQLDHEITRLIDLQRVNRSVRTEEIDLLVEQKHAIEKHLSGARLRLDALRLIQRGPV